MIKYGFEKLTPYIYQNATHRVEKLEGNYYRVSLRLSDGSFKEVASGPRDSIESPSKELVEAVVSDLCIQNLFRALGWADDAGCKIKGED